MEEEEELNKKALASEMQPTEALILLSSHPLLLFLSVLVVAMSPDWLCEVSVHRCPPTLSSAHPPLFCTEPRQQEKPSVIVACFFVFFHNRAHRINAPKRPERLMVSVTAAQLAEDTGCKSHGKLDLCYTSH